MQHVQPGDNLTVALITESSANEINYWIQKDFPQFNPDTDNERKVKRREKAVAKEHLAEVGRVNKVLQDSILNSPRIASQTEILSALHVAASVFKNKDYPQKKLVILSDMEEYGPTYKFPSERLDEKRIHYVLEQERKKPQGLPRLGGVEVYVCGAHSKNSDHFFEVRNFWVQYLKECGADIQEEHYGASLNGL
jgi:hypothetical protein